MTRAGLSVCLVCAGAAVRGVVLWSAAAVRVGHALQHHPEARRRTTQGQLQPHHHHAPILVIVIMCRQPGVCVLHGVVVAWCVLQDDLSEVGEGRQVLLVASLFLVFLALIPWTS